MSTHPSPEDPLPFRVLPPRSAALLLLPILFTHVPVARAQVQRLTEVEMVTALKLAAIDTVRDLQVEEAMQQAIRTDEKVAARTTRMFGDGLPSGSEMLVAYRKLNPRFAVPDEARFDPTCVISSLDSRAAFTLGASSLSLTPSQMMDILTRYAYNKPLPMPPEAERALKMFWEFYLPRGYQKISSGYLLSKGIDALSQGTIARAWLPGEGDMPGVFAELQPYAWASMHGGCLNNGPTIVIQLDPTPGMTRFRVFTADSIFASAARERAPLQRSLGVNATANYTPAEAVINYMIGDLLDDYERTFGNGEMDEAERGARRANARLLCRHLDMVPAIHKDPDHLAEMRAHCAALPSPTVAEQPPAKPKPVQSRAQAAQAWKTCAFRNVPEAGSLSERASRAADKGDTAELNRLMPRLKALHRQAVEKCGPDPDAPPGTL